MGTVDWSDVRARRLRRSSLADRAGAARLVEVARELGGVHAQVQASAELQLAARVDGIVQADVREALWESRALVKAWTVRGTLHLHPADELPLWLAARRAVARDAGREGLEAWRDPDGVLHPALAPEEVDAVHAAVWTALDGRRLRREELAEEVAEHVGPAARSRLRSGFAFFLGDLCQGPPQGARITLARPDQWLDGWGEVDEDEALREVCRRFLRTYGPARPVDFREWFGARGFTSADARALFAGLGDELEQIEVGGRAAYVPAGDTSFASVQPTVRLLPEYDVYVMGFREREVLVPERVRELVAAHARGRYEGPAGVRFVLVDGVAAGLWERTRRGRRIELHVTLARRLGRPHRAELAREAERIGAFLGLEPALTVETA